jgi:hypothetical protein
MSADTVTKLQQNQYQLYGFKGVDGPPNGVPLVWFATNVYSTDTAVNWTEQYSGYTSLQSNVAPGTQITASFSADMGLGQLMTVNIGGVGAVTNNGEAGQIEIINATTTPYTCGIGEVNQITGVASPMCAFPLFGLGLDAFTPIELVYFMFATNVFNTGTVIEQSFAPGVLVDLTGGNPSVALHFDINTGWSGPGNTTNYPAQTNLLPLLLNYGGPAAVSVRAGDRRRRLLAAA